MIAGFSITSLLLILLAGIGAGFVGYAVGASSLVSYPALLAFGIPPVLANASNTVGVVGTGIGGVMGARKELKGQAVRSITYVVIGAFGGVAGAFLLLKLDPSVFEFAAPVLILLSSLIIAINPRGRMQAKQAAADATAQLKHIEATEATEATEAAKRATTPTAPHRPPEQLVQPMSQDSWWVWLGVAAVAIYSGYFGAGAGTLALAVLDAAKIGPFHKINALKTLDRHRREHQRLSGIHHPRRGRLAGRHHAVHRMLHRRGTSPPSRTTTPTRRKFTPFPENQNSTSRPARPRPR